MRSRIPEPVPPVHFSRRKSRRGCTRGTRGIIHVRCHEEDRATRTGMTQAGGIDLPGEIAGVVALDELVIHGWDVARASGQRYDADARSLDAVANFVQGFSSDGTPGLFGPRVPVRDSAPQLERVIGMAGRDPNWSPK